jgi:ABC-type antimicrobial peptide transport system permease subunit
MLEAVVVSLSGAMMGVAFGFLSVKLLERSPQMIGVFEPDYPAGVFRNALLIAFGMAFFGAVFPAIRAAILRPLDAIRHE